MGDPGEQGQRLKTLIMGLFKRKTRAEADADVDTLSFRLGKWYKGNEMRLATYLNKKTSKLSFRCWLIMLVGFCLVVGGYLGYLLLGIFN